MTEVITKVRRRHTDISAVVTRADGRVEDLGLIYYYDRNPLKRWPKQLYIWIKERIRHR